MSAVEKYTNSPVQYHFWVAATAISASLKRHVYINRGPWKLYPNLYTVLVGHPAIGKGEALSPGLQALRKANSANIMSDRITIEWIKQELSKGFASPPMVSSGGTISIGQPDSSCLLVAPELSVFLRFPEDELPDLADLWDSRPEPQMYGTRSKGLVTITSPCPSMLAGCAPEWLKDAVPPSAVGGGFARRVNFVYADKPSQMNPWPDDTDWTTVLAPLVEDLKHIHTRLHGEYKFDNAARPAFEKVFMDQYADMEDEATFYYSKARWSNAGKLAMAIAASKRDDLVILKEDMEEADAMTLIVRDDLRKVFRGVGSSDLVSAGDKVVQFLETSGTASKAQIQAAMWKHCTHLELDVIMTTLRDGGIIVDTTVGGKSMWKAVPQYIGSSYNNSSNGTSAKDVYLRSTAKYGTSQYIPNLNKKG